MTATGSALLARLWALIPQSVQWVIIWLLNPKVVTGVSGVILNDQNQVLLLRHRFHQRPVWGLPGGWLKRGEHPAEGLTREIQEETGFRIAVEMLLDLNGDGALRMEVCYLARIVGGTLCIDPHEILEAGLFAADRLPAEVEPHHVRLIERAVTADWTPTLHLPEGKR